MKRLIFITILVAFTITCYAQATLTLQSITAAPGTNVTVPVIATNITDMTGFQFTIEFDNTKLTYINCSNWSGGTNGGAVTIGAFQSTGKLIFVYSDIAAVNIVNGLFFNINFAYAGGTANLNWSDNPTVRELSNSIPMEIQCTYYDGTVTETSSPPVITTHPVSQTLCQGGAVSFSVAASGTPPLFYQWKKNGTNVTTGTGGNTSTYVINPVGTNHAGTYTCVVTNAAGADTSNPATLAVNPLPVAASSISGPGSVTVGQANVAYSHPSIANATSYLWSYSGTGVTINGTSNNVTLSFAQNATSGNLTVRGVNACGNGTISQAYPITVNQPAQATLTLQSISANPGTNIVVPVIATNIADMTGFQFTIEFDNTKLTYTNCSNWSGGTNAGAVTIGAFQSTGKLIFVYSDIAAVNIVNGLFFNINFAYAGGTANLNWSDNPTVRELSNSIPMEIQCTYYNGAVTEASSPPVITTNPVSQTLCAGSAVSFSIAATGTSPIFYQWKKNGSNVTTGSGQNSSTYSINPVGTNHAGIYTCVVSNATGADTSNPATLTVNTLPAAASSISGPGSVTVGQANVAYSHPSIANATSYLWSYSGTGVTINGTSNNVTLSFAQNATSGNLTVRGVNTCGNGTNSQAYPITVNQPAQATLTLQSISANPGTNIIVPVIATNIADMTGFQFTIEFDNTKLTYINCSNWSGGTNAGAVTIGAFQSTGKLIFVYSDIAAVNIVNGLFFNINFAYAGGTANLNWSDNPTVRELSNSIPMEIQCTYYNGAVTEASSPPVITAHPVSQTLCQGGAVSFSVTASGTPPLFYQWKKNGTNVTTGTGGNTSTYVINPVGTNHAGTYTCVVTNADGADTSNPATLAVNQLPAITLQALPSVICHGTSSLLSAQGAATYSWSHGLGSGANKTVTPTGTTTYTVTGTDLNGCTATANVTVTVNATPAVSASALPASICAGNSSLLTASGAATYAWSHGLGAGATKTVTPNTTTTYAVTGTDLNGCSAMAQVVLTVNPLPVADAGPNQTITSGNCATLTASGGIQYQWNTNPVQSSQTILVCPAATQSYQVTVTDGNGCSATDQVQVTVTLTAPDTIDISIDTVWSCTLDTIPVPVRAQHFNNIGSIALTITLDTSLFSFAGLSEIHPLLQPISGGVLIANSAFNKVIVAWFSTASISTGDNMLFKLMLKSKNLGASALAWDFSDPNNNVITDINGLALPVKYHQGKVEKAGCANVSGSVNYLNAALTPLSNTQVWITRLSTTISSTASNSNGGFSFSTLSFGEHQLNASSSKLWGGGNSNDALLILKHFVGHSSLAGLYLKAADVDGSGGVNATDAMQVARRFVNLIPTLPAGDWVFDNPILNINAVNQTQNIQALCYGDVNGSYTNIAKNQLQAVRSVTYTVANEEWTEVPVSLQYSGNIHSISLVLNYDPNIISIQAINPVIEEGDFFINHNHGEIRIAWYALKGYHIQASAELIRLKVKMIHKDAIQNWLTIGPESQVGNLEDDVLDVKVVIPDIVAGNNESLLSFEVYPVPARDVIRVGITAPFAGMGQFRIINLTGQVVMEILPIYCESGRNEALLNTNSLTPGVYFINLQFVTETSETVSQSKRLVIIR